MEKTSNRRRFLTLAAISALGPIVRPQAARGAEASGEERWLNLYMYGPFAFVIYKDEDPHITLLASCVEDHSIAALTTSLSENPVPCGDWALDLGDTASNKQGLEFGSGGHIVDARALKLKVDPDKKRYFTLRLPMPQTVWPLRPYEMEIGGKTAAAPVGLLARYRLAAGATPRVTNFTPEFSEAEAGQLSLFLEYRPMYDGIDCGHRHAKRAFARLVELLPPLQLSLNYADMHVEDLSPCDRTCPSTLRPSESEPHPRYGMGHNCRAPVLIVLNPPA